MVAGYEAPVYVAWSPSNRSPLIRIPASRGMGTRIELRSVDPAANPYLAMAVILAAGLDGIKNKIEAPSPVNDNLYEKTGDELATRGICSLPSSLKDALDLFASSELIEVALGEHIITKYLSAKYKEYDEYRISVHDWELKRYMSLL